MSDNAPVWITETDGAVRRASDVVQAQQELKAVSEASGELDQFLDELERLAEAADLGRGSWWPGLTIPASLRAGLGSVEGNLERRQLVVALKELKQFTTKARNSLLTAWKDYVDSKTGDTAELQELVDLLASGGNLAVAGNLKRALAELQELKRRLPDVSSVERLTETVALAEAFEAALPEAVKAFISAAAQGGASIGLLNAEVMTWLDDNGAVDNFKVVAGKPVGVQRG